MKSKLNIIKLKEFIKDRRKQANDLLNNDNFFNKDKANERLRQENSRAFHWILDELEYQFPELKTKDK